MEKVGFQWKIERVVVFGRQIKKSRLLRSCACAFRSLEEDKCLKNICDYNVYGTHSCNIYWNINNVFSFYLIKTWL